MTYQDKPRLELDPNGKTGAEYDRWLSNCLQDACRAPDSIMVLPSTPDSERRKYTKSEILVAIADHVSFRANQSEQHTETRRRLDNIMGETANWLGDLMPDNDRTDTVTRAFELLGALANAMDGRWEPVTKWLDEVEKIEATYEAAATNGT